MSSWDGKSRGSVLGHQLFVFSIKSLGLPFTYFILRWVALYYFLFDRKPRAILQDLYVDHLGYDLKKANKLIYRNFIQLGRSMLDRIAFLVGRREEFTFIHEGHEHFNMLEERGEGAILISAHLGNWALAGNMLRSTDLTVPINVVMFQAEYEKSKDYLDRATGGQRFNIITISDDLSHMIRIKAALNKGEFICIHGDRFIPGARTATQEFLGSSAKFPLGPFEIAARFKVPACFVYNIKTAKYEYTLRSTDPAMNISSAVELQRDYVKDLELNLKQYPEHWFNYYDFFKT